MVIMVIMYMHIMLIMFIIVIAVVVSYLLECQTLGDKGQKEDLG